MKLNKKQEKVLTQCVANYVVFIKSNPQHKQNYAGAFGFGLLMAMKCAKPVMCMCCNKWNDDKGCKVKKCPLEEEYTNVVLETINEQTKRLGLMTIPKED